MRFACPVALCLALAIASAGAASLDFASSPCSAPEARQFDFWIGEWDVLNRHLMPDGVWKNSGRATNKVYSVLDGCAIIEHWEGALGGRPLYGFSIRAWDSGSRTWKLVLNWPSPDSPRFGLLEGVFTHGRGEFFYEHLDEDQNEIRERYTFSDATEDSLRWDAARSSDDGVTWSTYWIMEFTRRDPARDLPLFNGPEHSRSRCHNPEARQLDFMLGTWTRSRRAPEPGREPGTADARVRAIPILEGCAIMEFTDPLGEDPAPESFSIRSYLPSESRWVQYTLDTRRRVFERWEGALEEGKLVLRLSREEDGAEQRRQVWTPLEEGAWETRREVSADGGKTWSVESASRLTRVNI